MSVTCEMGGSIQRCDGEKRECCRGFSAFGYLLVARSITCDMERSKYPTTRWRNSETTSGLTSTICDSEHPRSSGSLSSSEWQFVVVSMPTPDVYCHRFCLVPRHTKGSQEFLNGKFPDVSLTKLAPIQGQTKQALAKCKGNLGHRSELINRCTFLKELTLS